MPIPCEQADKIDAITTTLTRMEKSQERLIDLLEKVANQEARLDHLEEHAETTHTDTNTLYERVREVELNQAANGVQARLRLEGMIEELTRQINSMSVRIEKLLQFYRWTTSKWAVYCYVFIGAVIGLNALSLFANHSEWLESIWFFYKGWK